MRKVILQSSLSTMRASIEANISGTLDGELGYVSNETPQC